MTYPPPPGSTPDPYGQQQPQDPFANPPSSPYSPQQPTQDPFASQSPKQDSFPSQPPNPYAQQASTPPPSSTPPAAPYGQPYGQQSPYGYSAPPPQNSMALTAMILSLVGIAVWITAPVGAILGHVALKQIRQTGESGEGMAKTGIIVGWILTGIGVLCCLGYIGIFATALSSGELN